MSGVKRDFPPSLEFMKIIFGIKEKMTQYFDEKGVVHAATLVRTSPLVVIGKKTVEKDGYNALVVGYGEQKEGRLAKSLKGFFGQNGNFRFVSEIRTDEQKEIGEKIEASLFEKGDNVSVTGTSKGKGFQGVVKRHGFKGGRRSHGQKHSEREPGSIGGGLRTRVPKGMRMAGRMGNDTVTVKNLQVIEIDSKTGDMLIKGALPGRKGTVLRVENSI